VYSSLTKRPAQNSSVARRCVQMLAAGLCLAAAVAISALITGRFGGTSARVLLTGLAAALCTIGGLAGSTLLSLENRKRRVGEATIGLSQLLLLLALVLIWIPGATDGSAIWRALGVTSALMLAGVHASLLLSRLDADDLRAGHRLGQVAIGCATSAALLISVLFAGAPIASGVWRPFGVLVVLAVLNTLLVPLARRIAREDRSSTGDDCSESVRPCV
jgi:FtsH-binding integral membrane protein